MVNRILNNIKKLNKKTVTATLLVLALMLSIIAFGSTRVITERVSEKISGQYTQELNAQTTAHISSTLNHYFEELDSMGASLKQIDGLDQDKLNDFISSLKKTSDVEYIAFVDTEGYVYDGSKVYLGITQINFIGNLLNGETKLVSSSETIGTESYVLTAVSYEYTINMGDRKLCGAIYGSSNDKFSEHIVLTSDFSGGYTSIMLEDGSYVIKNPSEAFDGLNVFSILRNKDGIPDEEIAELKEAFSKDETKLMKVSGLGEENAAYLFFAPVEGTDWYVINCLPASVIRDSVEDLQRALTIIMIVIILFVVVIALVIVFILSRSKKEIDRALAKAEEASMAKTTFLNNMSHDIRTPMNAIIGMTNIAKKQNEDEVVGDCLDKIGNSSSHLLTLINDVLDLSRIESGKTIFQPAPVDIRIVTDEVLAIAEGNLTDRELELVVNRAPLENPYVMADTLRIKEVLVNILSNAVKYTNDGGTITFTTGNEESEDGNHITLRYAVTDTGVGMSDEFVETIFDEFSQEVSGARTQYKGTGLGMAITKKYVELMGGTISVETEKNVGSTFIVELPMEFADPEDVTEKYVEEEEISIEGMKLLMAEDNELNAEIAQVILEEMGAEVTWVEDGVQTVQCFRDNPPETFDAILMDVMMPEMNGYEATGAIRNMDDRPDGKTIPIVAMTANAFAEDVQAALDAGMNGHIAKPIYVDEVKRTIHRCTSK